MKRVRNAKILMDIEPYGRFERIILDDTNRKKYVALSKKNEQDIGSGRSFTFSRNSFSFCKIEAFFCVWKQRVEHLRKHLPMSMCSECLVQSIFEDSLLSVRVIKKLLCEKDLIVEKIKIVWQKLSKLSSFYDKLLSYSEKEHTYTKILQDERSLFAVILRYISYGAVKKFQDMKKHVKS